MFEGSILLLDSIGCDEHHRSCWGPLDFFGFALITPGPVRVPPRCLERHERSASNSGPQMVASTVLPLRYDETHVQVILRFSRLDYLYYELLFYS